MLNDTRAEIDAAAALDAVSREDFPDDESYLRAATKIQLERSTPEYRRTYASLAAEYRRRQEARRRAL